MRNKRNQELDELVYQSLSSGKNKNYVNKVSNRQFKDINESIKRIQSKLASVDTRTNEEKEVQKKLKIIRKLIKDGKSPTQINKITGYPRTTIERYINKLINSKKIKREDIKNEKEELKKRVNKRNEIILALIEFNIPYDIIAAVFDLKIETISLIKRKYDALFSKESNERDEKILALIEFKVPYKIISAIFNISINSIKAIKRKHDGVKTGFTKEKKIKKQIAIKEIDDTLTELEVNIIKYLKSGYYYTYIGKKMSISQKALMDIISSLKERSYISQSFINEARDNRNLYYKEMILKLYNDAVSEAEIYRTLNQDDVEELSYAYINRIINKLKDAGLIDDDKIKQLLDDKPESFASIDERALPLLIKGLTVKEIIESDETRILTESRVRRSKKRLIAAGKITEEDIIKYQKKRKRNLQKKQKAEEDKKIWYYLETYGFSNLDIAEQLDISYNYVCTRVKSIARRKKMSDQDLKDFRKKALIDGQKISFFTYEEDLLRRPFLENKNKFLNMYESSVPSKLVNTSYFNSFKELLPFNYSFDKQEIDILCYAVLYTDELCTQENIFIGIMNYLYINEFESAIQTLNTFISLKESNNQSYAFKQQMMKTIDDYKKGKKKRLNILS